MDDPTAGDRYAYWYRLCPVERLQKGAALILNTPHLTK